jgi:signal transduction histidine kinase
VVADRELRRLQNELATAERRIHEPLKLALVSPLQLLEEVEAELADSCKGSNVALWTRVDIDLPSFLADGVQLRSALIGMGETAVASAGDGGEVLLEAERRHRPDDESVTLRVTDSGSGAAHDPRARLPLAAGIAADHGGHLRVDPAPDGGSIITLDLPFVAG